MMTMDSPHGVLARGVSVVSDQFLKHLAELIKVDIAVAIQVNLVDDILPQLVFTLIKFLPICIVAGQRRPQLGCLDRATVIRIEQCKCLL